MLSHPVFNPATGNMIEEFACDTSSSLLSKFQKAQSAQEAWRATKMEERTECIKRFHALLKNRLETLALDLTRETGKPIAQSRAEIRGVSARIDFFLERAPAVLADSSVTPIDAAVEELIAFEPLGVISNISAWNYPYFVGLNVIVPALLAGNAVFYKPSELALLSGHNIQKLLLEAGLPSALIPMAIGKGDVGETLLTHDFEGVFFTGSYATGKKILHQVYDRMKRVQLELGGKDGVYVCDDSDLNFAVPSIAEGAFYNAGQSCCSVERIFVHDSIFEKFKAMLVDEVRSYKIGDPQKEDTFIGPLTRPSQIDFLKRQLGDAIAQGGNILLGGEAPLPGAGSFFSPTIVECHNSNSAIMQDESFGPVVALQRVYDDAEATTCLNDSSYGLTAGVYSKDQARAKNILGKIRVGSAYWNCCDRVSPRLPWSGRKYSGIGTTLSDEGIRCFTYNKAWYLRGEPKIF